MDSPARFVVTAWRNRSELLQLRLDIYSPETARRQRAVNKVFAWRLRKPDGLPLLLDSTADIVDVMLQDERAGLTHNALRLLYATAISRFVTGLADTQIELTRDRPAWFPPGKSLQLPLPLMEVRHRIVHRHLPTLGELKRAANDSLDWLWEWYWSQLDHAFPSSAALEGDTEPDTLVRERLQSLLKTYVRERKSEIKTRSKDARAAATALANYTQRYGANKTTTHSAEQAQRTLLRLAVHEKMMLPAEKKLGSSMSGAFLIWDPFWLALCPAVIPVRSLLAQIIAAMNHPEDSSATPSTTTMTTDPALDPTREGLHDWAAHILCSQPWARVAAAQARERVLADLFSEPTTWNVRLAGTVLERGDVGHVQQWRAVLDAAVKEGAVESDGEEAASEQAAKGAVVKGKISGPTKVMGLWRPRPLGWLPEGWEYDE
ncbi:rRNA-processing protein las1 [Coniothyrium glycines]